jgi:hypothetical protein
VRGQGATNCIATTASEAKKGKGKTKEGFAAETVNIIHHHTKFCFNEFVANAFRDNIGIVNFDF